MPMIGPRRLTSITASITASGSSRNRPAGMIPARARYCRDKHLSAMLKQEAAK